VNQNTGEDLVLFSSLKGIVNLTQPRIFSYEGDAFAEGPYTWLTSLGYSWNQISDNWSLISKYRSEISGIIVYDTNVINTVNLATTLAGSRRALVASPSQVARLTAAPYNLPILMDLRGQFTTKLQVLPDAVQSVLAEPDSSRDLRPGPEQCERGCSRV